MKLAIIIPTYDNLSGLKRLVRQIYKYTDGEFKIYIVEDGQGRETSAWLWKQVSKNLEAIFHRENKGVAPSWNDGLKAAMRDGCTHFAIVNDDIQLCEDWWKRTRILFEKHGINFISLDQPCPIPFTGWFFVLDLETIDKVGFFDEQFVPYTCEDMDYAIRLQQTRLKRAKINLPIKHIGSATIGKIKKKNPVEFRRVWNENWKRLRAKYPTLNMQDNLL